MGTTNFKYSDFYVGVDGSGKDFKVFGTTTGAYMLWDMSADRLNVVTVAARAISGEEHAFDVTMAGVCSSGDSMVGGNFAVTPTGTAATWVSGIYAKVTQGATKAVNGYISAAEFEVVNSADSVSDWFLLVLNASNSGAQQGSHSSYIALRDYGSTDIQSFLWVSTDFTIGSSATDLIATKTSAAVSHVLRIIVGSTPYWIMVSNQL